MNYTHIFKQFYEFHHKHVVVKTLPQITHIEITNNCNLNCIFCSRDYMQKYGKGNMRLDQFKHLVDRYGWLMRNLRLYLHGEPLLHPDAVEMVRYAKHHSEAKTIGFATNGTLLTLDLFKRLVDAGVSSIDVSYEGTDKESYEATRIGANYDRMEGQLREIAAYNASAPKPVRLKIHAVDTVKDHALLDGFVQKWQNTPGITTVTTGELGDWSETVTIEHLKPEGWKGYVDVALPVCPAPWFVTDILWNGNVIPCCQWLSDSFGNIFRDSLETIWNNSRYVAMRTDMLKGRSNVEWCNHCLGCSFYPLNSLYLAKQSRWYPFCKSFLQQLGYVMG